MASLSNINGKFVVEQTTGYVGIGTTDPNFLIEAAGANSEIALNSTSASIYRLRSTSSDSFIITKNGVGDRLVINGSGNATFTGNVGIGGTPSVNFEVNKTGARVKLIDGTNQLNMGLWDGVNYRFEGDANRPMFFTSYQGNINFGISGGTSMTIQNDKVGIGTTSPDALLELEKSASNAVGPTLLLNNSAGGNADKGNIIFASFGNTYQRAKIEFKVSSETNNPGNIDFYTGRSDLGTLTQKMTILGSGNVGIGTASPSQKLEVTGNFKLNGTLVQEGTGNNLTFKYRTANSNAYTGGNANCKFGRFYWTPAHWVTGAPVIKVTLHCKYYQGERREYIIKAGYQNTDPIINELQPSSTQQTITLVVGATTSAGYNYAGQPVYYVDLQWVQTSYIWGWALIESQVGFLTSNPTSGWGGVVMDSGITQTNGGLVTNNTSFFAGNLGVGTELPTSQLYVNNTVDGDKIRWGKSNVLVGSVGTYNGVPYIGYQGGAGGGIMFNGTSIEPTALGSNRSSNINDIGSANYRWRNAYLGGGIYLGGTATAHKLDFYKTDTWAPQIYYQNATDQANATNSTQTGIYTKIGNVCTVQFRLIWNQASGTPAVDNIGIKNLPFGGNTTQAYAEVPCILIGYTGGPSPRGNLTLTLPGANQTLALFNDTNNVGNMGNAIGSGTKEIRFSFTYLTN